MPFWLGPQTVRLSWIAGGATGFVEEAPGRDSVRLAGLSWETASASAAVVVSFVAAAFLLFSNRPRLVLDQAGVTIRCLARQRLVRWDDLLPGGPPSPVKQGLNSKIKLHLRPAEPHTAPAQVKVPTLPALTLRTPLPRRGISLASTPRAPARPEVAGAGAARATWQTS